MASIDFFRPDRNGIQHVLTHELRGEINALAERVAAHARASGRTVARGEQMPVTVTHYTTDRAAAAVTIAHPAGLAIQAKHGTLTRAAAAAGLEVRAR